MLIWAGHEVSETHLLVGGVLISCVGWVNAIVYIITRHVFRAERSGSTPSVRMRAEPVLSARRFSVPGHGPNTMAMDQIINMNNSSTKHNLEALRGREGVV